MGARVTSELVSFVFAAARILCAWLGVPEDDRAAVLVLVGVAMLGMAAGLTVITRRR